MLRKAQAAKNNPALAYILNMELYSMESYKLNTDNQNCFVGWLHMFWETFTWLHEIQVLNMKQTAPNLPNL